MKYYKEQIYFKFVSRYLMLKKCISKYISVFDINSVFLNSVKLNLQIKSQKYWKKRYLKYFFKYFCSI